MAWLVEIFLPITDNRGAPYPAEIFEALEEELAAKYGGVTAFARAPAQGRWQNSGHQEQDDILILEVMTPNLYVVWWHGLRRRLEQTLRQKRILMRAQEVRKL